MKRLAVCLGLFLVVAPLASGQTLEEVLEWSQRELKSARDALSQVRNEILDEKIPLTQQLRETKHNLLNQKEKKRIIDEKREGGNFEVDRLKSQATQSKELSVYLENQAIRFRQELESHLVPGERHSYAKSYLEMDRVHSEPSTLTERAESQWQIMADALERLEALAGGAAFETRAVSDEGVVENGSALQFGPIVFFKARERNLAGNLLMNTGLTPELQVLSESHQASVDDLFKGGKSVVSFDPTLGQATLVYDDSRVPITEHLVRGGFWMIPICLFGACALSVGILKWMVLQKAHVPSVREFKVLSDQTVDNWSSHYRGATRKLLIHLVSLKESAPEVQAAELDVAYQEFKFKMNRWLPVIALTAGVSPLLGLLGTVTGMIKTFQLISVFGAGDAKLLSSGISEALITTEFGLIVAIPALVGHAYLNRRVKKILVRSVNLLEQVSRGIASRT